MSNDVRTEECVTGAKSGDYSIEIKFPVPEGHVEQSAYVLALGQTLVNSLEELLRATAAKDEPDEKLQALMQKI